MTNDEKLQRAAELRAQADQLEKEAKGRGWPILTPNILQCLSDTVTTSNWRVAKDGALNYRQTGEV